MAQHIQPCIHIHWGRKCAVVYFRVIPRAQVALHQHTFPSSSQPRLWADLGEWTVFHPAVMHVRVIFPNALPLDRAWGWRSWLEIHSRESTDPTARWSSATLSTWLSCTPCGDARWRLFVGWGGKSFTARTTPWRAQCGQIHSIAIPVHLHSDGIHFAKSRP